MQIKIYSHNIELTDSLKSYVEKKVQMLEKFFDKIIEVDVEVELTTHHHQKGPIYRAEMNVSVPGKLIRVEKTTDELFKSIDKAKDHMARELDEYKEKMIDRQQGKL